MKTPNHRVTHLGIVGCRLSRFSNDPLHRLSTSSASGNKEKAELIPAISPEDDDAEERAKRFTEYILQLDYEKDENGHTVLSEEFHLKNVLRPVVQEKALYKTLLRLLSLSENKLGFRYGSVWRFAM